MGKRTQVYQLKDISLFDKIGYGSGNLGYGIVNQVTSAYLVFYATAVLNIPGSLIGVAVAIGVIWDAVTDPVMGYISDNTRFKTFGRRHLYLLIGGIGTFVFNYLLWVVNPSIPVYAKFLWILIDLLAIKTFTTIYATPYTALGAELSSDYNERTSIQGFKMVFFLIGLCLATVMGMAIFFRPTAQFSIGQLNPLAYRNIGITSSVLMLIFAVSCYYTTKKYIPLLPKALNDDNNKSVGIKHMFRSFADAFKNKYYKYIVFGYLFTNIASAMVATIGMHVFTYTFSMHNNSIAIIIAAQFIVSIISQPVWVAISKKIDKKPAVIVGLIISIIGTLFFLILVLARNQIGSNFIYMIPYSILVGFGTGGLFSLPLSMIADTIDLEEYNTGIRSEGIYYGCLTLSYKFSQSIAIFLLGILIDLVKFDSRLMMQAERTKFLLGLILPLGSITVLILALISYSKYDLDKEQIAQIQNKILSDKENRDF